MEAPKSNIFLTAVNSTEDISAVKILIKSLRAFGGRFNITPIYIYTSLNVKELDIELSEIQQVIPYVLNEPFHSYPFAYKVFAVSNINKHLTYIPERIIWLDPASIILKPPVLFDLPSYFEIIIRPVHIKNVGVNIDKDIGDYWKNIYSIVAVDHCKLSSVQTYVDKQEILPYFNCGMYVINAKSELLKLWWELFKKMVEDTHFQNSACAEIQNKIFLHQSIFSALICKYIPFEKIHILPREYGYPVHFHERLSKSHEGLSIDDVVIMLGYTEDISDEDKLKIYSTCSAELRTWLVRNAIACKNNRSWREIHESRH